MKLGLRLRESTLKYTGLFALGLVLVTLVGSLIMKGFEVGIQNMFYPLLLLMTGIALIIDVHALTYFKKSSYKKFTLGDFGNIFTAIVGSVFITLGVTYMLNMYEMSRQIFMFITSAGIYLSIAGVIAILFAIFTDE